MRRRAIRIILGVWAMGAFAAAGFADSVVQSKHNLSVSGPGTVKGTTEKEICVFCHTPHNASSAAPLWNRYESGKSYIPYTSTTLRAKVGQPTGASKLCLSCHDGTVAPGMVRSRIQVIPFTQPLGTEETLGTDLSDDHPVSFRYDAALAFSNAQLADPGTLTGAVRLDRNGQLQCTSCHDPHNDQFGDFLRVDPVRGNLCLTCHRVEGWNESAHGSSPKSWNGVSPNPWTHTPWTNVADNACENCHDPHNALGKKRLLNASTEEGNCTPCHNGHVALKDVLSEFSRPSIHPIYSSPGLHDAAENALVSSKRHVGCSDCHNPHAANGAIEGSLLGHLRKVRGVNAQGQAVKAIRYEYELCFRCHSSSPGKAPALINRQFAQSDTLKEFDPSNQSFHPILNTGKNADVPSLIAPMTTSSLIACTDCHNSPVTPGPGGGPGPLGPHGSLFKPLLKKNLSFADQQTESLETYALCYKCHDRNNLLADRSFPFHKKHVADNHSPCTACHDPHGVKSYAHLINFDRQIVSENASNRISFTDSGRFHGSCSLKCHGVEHNNRSY